MREYVCMGTDKHVTEFRQSWMDRGVEMMKAVGLDGDDRRRQRSVLRPRRQDARQQPARPEPEVRAADPDHLDRQSDRLHELQLSPGRLRREMGPATSRTAASPTPPASASAWSASRWRCSTITVSTSRNGRRACARRSGADRCHGRRLPGPRSRRLPATCAARPRAHLAGDQLLCRSLDRGAARA